MNLNLVEHWGTVLRRSAVTWAIGFWGAVGSVIIMVWPVAQWAFDEVLPENPLWRVPFALATFAVTVGSVVFARLKRQPKLQAKLEEKRDA